MNIRPGLFNKLCKRKEKIFTENWAQYFLKSEIFHQGNSILLLNIEETIKRDDLYNCFRVVLRFGQILGLTPISGLFSAGGLNSTFLRLFSISNILSIFIISILIVYEALGAYAFFHAPNSDIIQIANNGGIIMFGGIGVYVYIFIHKNATKFLNLFRRWRNLHADFYLEDITLFRDVNIIFGVVFTSAILENLISYGSIFESSDNFWENFMISQYPQYASLLPANAVIVTVLFICNKFALYAWNFGDVLIMIIARAIYKRFKYLALDFTTRLSDQGKLTLVKANKQSLLWNQVVKDHGNLVDLLDEFCELLSPLVFACVVTNIYFICLTLHTFLAPSLHQSASLQNVYETWAFIHLIGRTFAVILTCAKVNEYAHKIEETLWKCPLTSITKEVERARFRLRTSKVGFGGLEFFIITKPFIMSYFNVISAIELVLLQSPVSGPASTADDNEPAN